MSRVLTRAPSSTLLAAAVVAFSTWFIVAPLFAAHYPPMTDLPFHAAETSILVHYRDESFHFREQFTLHPLSIPYISMYAIGALFSCVMPIVTAVKIAACVMLALMPAGLAVMCWGMKKSPLLGLLGLSTVYCTLTHWGFLNFVGGVGLFAMVLGETLLLVDKPSRGRAAALCLTLVALFFTHIFRFPFAVCAVFGAAISVAPSTRRIRPVLTPLVPSLALFALWLVVRPKSLGAGGMAPLAVHTERLADIPHLLVNGFFDPDERPSFVALLRVIGLAGAGAGILGALFGPERSRKARLFSYGSVFAVASCALVALGAFLVLPMEIGLWWYVYPREATAAAFLALGLFPDLPKSALLRAALLFAIAIPLHRIGALVERDYAQFDTATLDFDRVVARLPKAPKLLYLIFDHGGSKRSNTPFIHLPAYVQATNGGWLSFHFASWGASPMSYRDPKEPGAVVPPKVPLRWEWRPEIFDVKRDGAFFDWFLIRDTHLPDKWFRADPSIHKVEHVGEWWLYKRN